MSSPNGVNGGSRTTRTAPRCSIMAGITPQKAELPIDIIVIGACVAGLATAYSLRQAGHNVLVLEAASSLRQSPSGIRVPPNMSRILFRWGLGPEIIRLTSGRCPKITFHSAYTGEVIGEILYHKKVMEALEGEVYFLHHNDLLEMLYKLAVGAGAKVRFGSRVVDVDLRPPSVMLASGKKLHADLIVGADGHQSVIRPFLEVVPKPREEINYTTYQSTVPASLFKDDEEFMRLIKEPVWNLWMSSDWAVLAFGVRNNTEFAVSFVRKEDQEDHTVMFDWRDRIPIRELDIWDIECDPLLKRILRNIDSVARIRGDRSKILETYSDPEGHVVVVGEAAHGWNPGSSHTAALGVEDAVVLGRLLSHLKSKDELKLFLSAYNEIRQPRSEWVCITEQQSMDFVALPSGPLTEARDAGMRRQLAQGSLDWTNAGDGYLRKCWKEFKAAFGYDAYDEADTWWVEWGMLFERMNASKAACACVAATATAADANPTLPYPPGHAHIYPPPLHPHAPTSAVPAVGYPTNADIDQAFVENYDRQFFIERTRHISCHY